MANDWVERRTVGLLAAVALLLAPAASAAADQDPRLPDIAALDDLTGPYPLEVVDARDASLTDPRWFGVTTQTAAGPGGVPVSHRADLRSESQVAHWLAEVVRRGAAGAGYDLHLVGAPSGDGDPPQGRLVLKVFAFFCDWTPLGEGCSVDLSLESSVDADERVVFWRYRSSEAIPGRLRTILREVAEDIADELPGALRPPPAWFAATRGPTFAVAWLDHAGALRPFTILRRRGDDVCVETSPPSWVRSPQEEQITLPGAAEGDPWAALTSEAGVVFGRLGVQGTTAVLETASRTIPYDAGSLLGRGYLPSHGSWSQDCPGRPGAPDAVWVVDRRFERVDIRRLRADPRDGRLRGLFLVSSNERGHRLTNSEAVLLLDNPDLNRRYAPRVAGLRRRQATDGITAVVMGSVLVTGIALGVGAGTSDEPPDYTTRAAIGATGGWLGGTAAVGLGVSLTRLGFATRRLKRLTQSRRPAELEDPDTLLDAIAEFNGL